MDRQNLESTCVGHGLMIPHAILSADARMEGMPGISTQGLNFKAPDGRPIHAILLLATPKNESDRHLEILAAFAHATTHDANLCEQLYHARSAAHTYSVLHADDAQDLNYFREEAIEEVGGAEDDGKQDRTRN